MNTGFCSIWGHSLAVNVGRQYREHPFVRNFGALPLQVPQKEFNTAVRHQTFFHCAHRIVVLVPVNESQQARWLVLRNVIAHPPSDE